MSKDLIFIGLILFIYFWFTEEGKSNWEKILETLKLKEQLAKFISTLPMEKFTSMLPIVGEGPQLKAISVHYCLLDARYNYGQYINMIADYRANATRFFAYCDWDDGSFSIFPEGSSSHLNEVIDYANSKGIWVILNVFTQYSAPGKGEPINAPRGDMAAYIQRLVSATKGRKIIYECTNETGGEVQKFILEELKKYGVLTSTYGNPEYEANYYNVHSTSKTYAGPSGDKRFIHSNDTPSAILSQSDSDMINIARGAMEAGGNFEFLLAWGRPEGVGGRGEGMIGNNLSAVKAEYGNVLNFIRDSL